jgi:hypothetical protein
MTESVCRGAGKKKVDGPPRAFAKSQTHPPTIRLFFLSKVLGVSRQGEFKNTIKIFLQKVHVEKQLKNFDKNFEVSFSSIFFVLSCFRFVLSCFGCFSAIGVQNTTKNVLQKKSCRKVFTKKSTKNPKPTFSRLFLSRFWAFLDEASSKTR